jgi:hypothetical protein
MGEGRLNLPAVRHGMGDGRWEMEDGRWKMEDGRWKMEEGTCLPSGMGGKMEEGTCLPSGMGWKRLYDWLRTSLIRIVFYRLDLFCWQ